jgi:kinetochore protein Mis12/MTW1
VQRAAERRWQQQTLLDDIINTVNELVFRAINAIESGLSGSTPESIGFRSSPDKEYPSDEARRDALLERKQTEIDTGIIQLESLLNNIVDKDFDKFEIYTLRNILAVGHEEESLARWVRLEHYKNLELNSSTTTITPEELLQQRRKVQETAKLNAMLKAEEARNQAVIAQLHTLTGQQHSNQQQPAEPTDQTSAPFSFLTSSPHTSTTTQPLSQNLQFALYASCSHSSRRLSNRCQRQDRHDWTRTLSKRSDADTSTHSQDARWTREEWMPVDSVEMLSLVLGDG